jgi:Ni/Co efflux regulator RcnB
MKLLLTIIMFVFAGMTMAAQTKSGTAASKQTSITQQPHKSSKAKTSKKNKSSTGSKDANETANKKASSTSTSGSGKKDN